MINQNIKYSVIIPVYNEEKVIGTAVRGLLDSLKDRVDNNLEIIAVNDGSSDDSLGVLKEIKHSNFIFVSNPYNKGYGASLKKGAKIASGKKLIFFDGDGQHEPEDVLRLIKEGEEYDMVVGARQGYKGPAIRQPGKKLLIIIASYLVDFKIPDLNSGLRLVDKKLFNKYLHLYPNNFSLTTTITLAFLKEGLNVKYIPIEIKKRVGKSTVSLKDAFRTLLLIARMITLFSPMKFFLPVSIIFGSSMIITVIYDLIHSNISDTSVLLFVSTILIFFFGLILDQIASIRRELIK